MLNMKTMVPYQIKKGLLKLMIAAAPLTIATSCDKDEPEIIKHDVTIEWGVGNFDKIYPVSKVADAAKPQEVRYVYAKVTDEPWGISTQYLRKNLLDELFAASPKIKGAGEFKGVEISSKADSLLFINWGFTFYKPKQK